MNEHLYVKTKLVFGRNLIYPVCPFSGIFSQLIGKKTFSPYDLYKMLQLGYTVQVDGSVFTASNLYELKEYCQANELYL